MVVVLRRRTEELTVIGRVDVCDFVRIVAEWLTLVGLLVVSSKSRSTASLSDTFGCAGLSAASLLGKIR